MWNIDNQMIELLHSLTHFNNLVVVNIVQSVSPVSSCHHWGIRQEVSAMRPTFKIKLRERQKKKNTERQ